jgi:thiol-disulfide isomerase/thioredoxin
MKTKILSGRCLVIRKDERETAERQAGGGIALTHLVAVAALSGVLGFLTIYLTWPKPDNAAAPAIARAQAQSTPAAASGPLARYAKGAVAAFVTRKEPEAVPDIALVDGDGKPRALKDWQGRVVLLNLWATWCAPCLKEMPALDRLKAQLGGPDFDVVALNIDRGGLDKPRKFLADAGIKSLELIQDPAGKAFSTLRTPGMPTTLLIDRKGLELGRLVGPAEWDAEDAKALVRAALAAK